MVAINATAILNDINLSASSSRHPAGASISMQIRKNTEVCRRFAYAILTACVNQKVSASAVPGPSLGKRGNVGNKVNARKTTPARKAAAPGGSPLTIA
jgi:hypothetical protein